MSGHVISGSSALAVWLPEDLCIPWLRDPAFIFRGDLVAVSSQAPPFPIPRHWPLLILSYLLGQASSPLKRALVTILCLHGEYMLAPFLKSFIRTWCCPVMGSAMACGISILCESKVLLSSSTFLIRHLGKQEKMAQERRLGLAWQPTPGVPHCCLLGPDTACNHCSHSGNELVWTHDLSVSDKTFSLCNSAFKVYVLETKNVNSSHWQCSFAT